MSQVYNYRACASLMLLGEHAVVHQGFGICAAIDQFITAKLELRDNKTILIKSSFGTYEGSIGCMPIKEPFSYVIEAINVFSDFISTGFELTLTSGIDPNIGFGSSAAVVVATLGALNLAFFHSTDPDRILKDAIKTVRQVQGFASGCDCAASVYGSTVAFNPRTFEIVKYHHSFDLTATYCGYKTKTALMINFVNQRLKQQPKEIAKIFAEIENLATLGMRALTNNDLHRFGELMTAQQHHMKELGVSNQDLDRLFDLLKSHQAILGAKISGAGGGDCVIGLGAAIVHLPIEMHGAKIIHLKTLPGYYGMS
ncbi:mevalonate kinase [bacterium]|nr:mevalonate kinase [bacterium]NBX71753.1 mevalonate kinase [bacterium]